MNFFQSRRAFQSFGRGAIKLNAARGESLSLDAIRQHAPTVFAHEAHSSRSERFAVIPTEVVLNGLIEEGFFPVSVTVGGSADDEKRGYTKHLIRFRREGEFVTELGGLFPEVVLRNANDGTSGYQLFAGLYRLVCLNGMITGKTYKEVRVPHRGRDVMGKVIEGSWSVIEESRLAITAAEEWSKVELNRDEQRVFAQAALQTRFDEVPEELQQYPERAIAVQRSADVPGNLWNVFNRAQENLVKGGIHWREAREREGQRQPQIVSRTSRPVRSVDGDVKLNRALWTLAEEFAKLKSAA